MNLEAVFGLGDVRRSRFAVPSSGDIGRSRIAMYSFEDFRRFYQIQVFCIWSRRHEEIMAVGVLGESEMILKMFGDHASGLLDIKI